MKPGCHVLVDHAGRNCEGQCDCACAQIQVDMDLKKVDFCEGELIQINSQLQEMQLDSLHVLVFLPTSEQNIAVIDSTTRGLLEQFKEPTKLEAAFFKDLTEQQVNDLLKELIALDFLCPVSE